MSDDLVGSTVSADWYNSNPLKVLDVNYDGDKVQLRDEVLGETAWAPIDDVTVLCEGHEWRGVSASLSGFGSMTTYVVEQCDDCGLYRKNEEPVFTNWEPMERNDE